jgi:soluble lytic murein transglycosylase-like protein
MRLFQITLIIFISLSIVVEYSDSAAASTGAKASKNNPHRGHKPHVRSKGKKHTARQTGAGDVWERIRLGLRIPRPAPASAGYGQIMLSAGKSPSAVTFESIKTMAAIRGNINESARLTTVIGPKKLIRGESQLLEKYRARQMFLPKKGIQNKMGLSPEQRYTRLRRLKLTPKKSSSLLTGGSANKAGMNPNGHPSSAEGDGLFKSPSVQRIRTRLGLHPELFNRGDSAENFSTDKRTGKNGKNKDHPQTAIRDCADLNKREIVRPRLARQGFLPEGYSQMAEQCRIKQNEIYERVGRHITGYSQRTAYLAQVSERARPYLYHIVDALSRHNLPLDLALLPIVESAYQATALSNKDAAGIWQFIPSTGREYGLQQSAGFDARLDITSSTRAAISFLSGLKDHFRGDWLLALAAYNCGQGAVDAAISRNQSEGLATDFWSLTLPAETQDYVPRLLALSSIFANPSSYGLRLRPVKNEPYFIKVNIDRKTDIDHLAKKDLRTIAKLADFNPEQFSLLNSAYIKSTLLGGGPFTLLMPISNANLLHQSLAFMAQSHMDGDPPLPAFSALSLSSEPSWPQAQAPFLAITVDEGQQWPFSVRQSGGGDLEPKSTGNGIVTTKSNDDDYWAVHYFDKGESLKAVAESHGITEEVLRVANKFKRKQSLSLGQRLLVPLNQISAKPIKKTLLSAPY